MIDHLIKINCDNPFCRTAVKYNTPEELLQSVINNLVCITFAKSHGWLIAKDNKLACCVDCFNKLNDPKK